MPSNREFTQNASEYYNIYILDTTTGSKIACVRCNACTHTCRQGSTVQLYIFEPPIYIPSMTKACIPSFHDIMSNCVVDIQCSLVPGGHTRLWCLLRVLGSQSYSPLILWKVYSIARTNTHTHTHPHKMHAYTHTSRGNRRWVFPLVISFLFYLVFSKAGDAENCELFCSLFFVGVIPRYLQASLSVPYMYRVRSRSGQKFHITEYSKWFPARE